jgi:hypothetical protein
MTTLNVKRAVGPKAREFPGMTEAEVDIGQIKGRVERQPRGSVRGLVQGPMSQQAALGLHGHDIHPQQFVRLVGCGEK